MCHSESLFHRTQRQESEVLFPMKFIGANICGYNFYPQGCCSQIRLCSKMAKVLHVCKSCAKDKGWSLKSKKNERDIEARHTIHGPYSHTVLNINSISTLYQLNWQCWRS